MAEKRMFSRQIVNSARFLRMPQTSRLLYYDLGMAADDDGYVEAFTVIRTTGAAEDDLRVLASKGFVSVLNDDLVTFINDWSINNLIRKDRYKPSLYKGAFSEMQNGNHLATNGIPSDNHSATQDRLGEERLGQDREDKGRTEETAAGKPPTHKRFAPPSVEEVQAYCKARNNSVDAQKFVDYYAARGWMAGKVKMRDWKAAVRTWERNGVDERGGNSGVRSGDTDEGGDKWGGLYDV